jgi:hypothetical protein
MVFGDVVFVLTSNFQGSPASSMPNLLQRNFSSPVMAHVYHDHDDDDTQDEKSIAGTDGGSLTSVD